MGHEEIKRNFIQRIFDGLGITWTFNFRRFAYGFAVEKWSDGFAWSIDFWPIDVMRTPPSKTGDVNRKVDRV